MTLDVLFPEHSVPPEYSWSLYYGDPLENKALLWTLHRTPPARKGCNPKYPANQGTDTVVALGNEKNQRMKERAINGQSNDL